MKKLLFIFALIGSQLNAQETITATHDTIQLGDSTVLNDVVNTSFLWSSGQTTQSVKVSPSVTTTYKVVRTTNGVSDSAFKTIYVDTSVVYDADAIALFNTVGDVPQFAKPHINTLIVGLKAQNVWNDSSFYCVICCPSKNAFNSLIEIKSRTIQASFYGNSAYSSPYNQVEALPTLEGFKFKTNGYLRTGFIPSARWSLNNSFKALSYSNAATIGSSYDCGANNSASQSTLFSRLYTGSIAVGDMYGTTVGTGRVQKSSATGTKGTYTENRNASNYHELRLNGTLLDSRTGSQGSLPTVEEYVNCNNNNGSPGTRRPNESALLGALLYCDGMSTTKAQAIAGILETFRVSMQRDQYYTKQIVLDGNSHTTMFMGKVFRMLQYNTIGDTLKYTNFGVSGQTTTQMLSDEATQIGGAYSSAFRKNILIVYELSNDMNAGATEQQAIANCSTYVYNAHQYGYWVAVKKQFCRKNPTSGAGLTTYPNATAWNLAVNQANIDIDNGATGADAVLPVDSTHFISRSNYSSDAAYNTAVNALITNTAQFIDQVHLSEAGYELEGNLDFSIIQRP